MPTPVRRRRPPTSCLLCRQRKVRCNQGKPCSNCLRAKNETCTYDTPHQPRRVQPHHGSADVSEPGLHSKTAASGTSKATAEPSLMQAMSKANQSVTSTPGSNFETMSTRLGGTFQIQCEGTAVDHRGTIARGATSKARLFGPSHWVLPIMMLVRDILDTIDAAGEETMQVWINIEKCKSLARTIKAQRQPPWPPSPTSDLPSKDVADQLVSCYISTCESMFRILHVPTFRKRYEALFMPGTAIDTAFFVQVKLVLCLGAITYDEKFSMRTSAVKWIREAQAWASEPDLRLDIQSLQTDLLLLIAQDRLGVSGNLMWISVGALIRKAVYMGLHRDPSYIPRGTTYDDEMHRRVWNTILEVALQSSLTCGGPPFLSLEDFDTAPPHNFDDEQLLTDNATPAANDCYTSMSVAIALRRTFPVRLAMVTFLNNISSSRTYEETIRLDKELRAAYKKLTVSLQACNGPTPGSSPSEFEIHSLEVLMHRYLSTLHGPYFTASLQESKYAYSRKVIVESSLKIWYAVNPPSAATTTQGQIHAESGQASTGSHMLQPLAVCSSGLYPTTCTQAAVFIAMELRAQLYEDTNLGPVHLRPDLLSILEGAKPFCLRVIEAGETNVKGFLLMSIIEAQVRGLMEGLQKDELARAMVTVAEAVGTMCIPILERMLDSGSRKQDGSVEDYPHTTPPIPTPDMSELGYTLSDALFGSFDIEPYSWMFNNAEP